MLTEGTFPNVADQAMSRSSPRVGDGFIRLDVSGGVKYASPNALSAYHRMGLASDLQGHNLMDVTKPLISDPFEGQELAAHIRDVLAGGVDPHAAAHRARCVGGSITAYPRRDRGQAPRPGAAVQGRHDP
ncbi:Probable two component sensor kinase [Mycobacteroides abscessus subsp. abscessus]|nr:Probable two component sensor kinase [Mycobacteroides abscessus subsp. abscessus]